MKRLAVLAVGVLLIGCSTYRPVVDMKGVNNAAYDTDLEECQEYAKEVNPTGSTFLGIGIGAGLGAILGAIVCAPLGGDMAAQCAGIGAGIGGVSGGAQGAGAGIQSQVVIIKNCMAGRGYKVLR